MARVSCTDASERERLLHSKTEYLQLYGLLKDLWLPVSRETGNLLYMLACASRARRIVEFGTSFGISTLFLAAALRDNGGGELITSEFEPAKVARAGQNLTAAGLEDLVEIRQGDALTTFTDLPDAIDAALDAWVEYAGERPALARLLLREIADAQPGKPSLFVQHAMPVLGLMEQAIREGQRLELFLPIDPIHFASTITGATVFFLVGTPLLGDAWPLDPRSTDQLAHLKEELRRVGRRLLGFVGPKTRARGKKKK